LIRYVFVAGWEAFVEERESSPAVSRRVTERSPTARGMMFTFLGECVLPNEGAAWTSAVLAVFDRLGVAEKATRQALMRTGNAGWLQSRKEGRRTRWLLTPAARTLLTDGAERIYSFGPAREWDGRWVIVQARIPESDRGARHMVRTRLSWAGFGSLGAGLWISPHAEREAEAIRALQDAGVSDGAHVFAGERIGPGDARAMVAEAWNLAAIDAEYEQFNAAFRAQTPTDVLVRQLELVHAWRRFPAVDPALPRELLPPRWAGVKAARIFADRHEQWTADARREWRRLNADA
jgi:phenylacetic acid degradation operon negative regulatory protein